MTTEYYYETKRPRKYLRKYLRGRFCCAFRDVGPPIILPRHKMALQVLAAPFSHPKKLTSAQTAQRHAFDEVALSEEEQHDNWQNHQSRSGPLASRVRRRVAADTIAAHTRASFCRARRDKSAGLESCSTRPITLIMPMAARAGFTCGSMMRHQVPSGPLPSILAASSSSLGIDMKNWRSRKMLNAEPEKRWHPQRFQGINPAQRAENQKLRHHRDRAGNHHRGQQNYE